MYSFKSMNTNINTFYLDECKSTLVELWFHYSEDVFSRFLPESELSQLNRSNGCLFVPSSVLYDVLVTANHFYKETDSLFNPFLCKVICDLGYDRSFEKLKTRSIKKRKIVNNITSEPLVIDNGMKSVTLANASIDLGGIAKGWTAQQIAYRLQKSDKRKGAISAGGDIVVWGEMEQGWDITIAHPKQLDTDLFSLKVKKDAGIATSSTLKRSWHSTEGETHHHIIDPRSLQSSESDLVQATILAPDLTTAEVYAKCMLILGWEDGIRWLNRKQPQLGVIGVKSDLTIQFSGAIDNYCPEGVKEVEPIIS